jgi:hypothetical protein
MMRKFGQSLALVVVFFALARAQAPAPDAAGVLAAARAALGGDKKVAAVRTIVATGRTRQVRGDNLVPIEFEIAIELPDKYIRKDEIPAQESGPTISGFAGDQLLQFPVPAPPPARAGGPPPPTAEQQAAAGRARLTTVRQDYARLMLGLFAASFDAYPLTFTYAGKAEAPQGKADVLDVTGSVDGARAGPGAFAARLFVNADSHLPIMIAWLAPAPPMRGGPPPAGQPPAPESRLYFGDYREVSGLQLPFRLRRALGPDTVEETTFDGFKINSKIDPRKFEVRK